MNFSFKAFLIGCGSCLIVGFIGGAIAWQKIVTPKVIEKTVTVTKTETKFVHDPDAADFDTLHTWAASKIKMEYNVGELRRDYTVLNVRAFDANKETKEEICVPVYQNAEWKVYAGIGAGVAVATIAGGAYAWKRLR